jgi:4-aminobutyrate aminotransferase / (S)-3-amino-2-methylpropionate transaminase / 5-aminovalerate transaminase
VWAISDRQDTIRMYPALNMDEAVLRQGLQVMEDAIQHVEEHGPIEGDAAGWPSGVEGF